MSTLQVGGLFRGIGILPMVAVRHGQDAGATFLRNAGFGCKESNHKRSSRETCIPRRLCRRAVT
ncbi:MAG: hypothetical protein WD063_14770, partial [Pirellulales bacterium]